MLVGLAPGSSESHDAWADFLAGLVTRRQLVVGIALTLPVLAMASLVAAQLDAATQKNAVLVDDSSLASAITRKRSSMRRWGSGCAAAKTMISGANCA